MTDHPILKREFLTWLQERGKERGYDTEVDYGEKLIAEPPRLLARTRASVDQSGYLNFKVKDEVKYDNSDFRKVYSIVLDAHSSTEWDPTRDSFYPLTLNYLKEKSTQDVNGDFPVTINLSDDKVKPWKNSIQRLFPTDEDYVPAGERITDEKTQTLNEIAKNL